MPQRRSNACGVFAKMNELRLVFDVYAHGFQALNQQPLMRVLWKDQNEIVWTQSPADPLKGNPGGFRASYPEIGARDLHAAGDD
jgi:hypothetical protein